MVPSRFARVLGERGLEAIWYAFILHKSRVNGVSKLFGMLRSAQFTSERGLEAFWMLSFCISHERKGSRSYSGCLDLHKSRVNGVSKHLGCFHFAQVTSERGLEGTHLRKLMFPAFRSQPIRNPSEIQQLSKELSERRLSHIRSRRESLRFLHFSASHYEILLKSENFQKNFLKDVFHTYDPVEHLFWGNLGRWRPHDGPHVFCMSPW